MLWSGGTLPYRLSLVVFLSPGVSEPGAAGTGFRDRTGFNDRAGFSECAGGQCPPLNGGLLQ